MAEPAIRAAQSSPPNVWVGEDEGQVALFIDGVVQSVAVGEGPLGTGYWPLMLPDVRPRAALLLGMGGATVAQLLVRRFGPLPITAVDNNHDVVRLAKQSFPLPFACLEIVETDAFTFVNDAPGPYDYVGVDLFANGAVPPRVFSRPFLRQLKALRSDGGLAAINYFKSKRALTHQHRLERVFPSVAVVQSEKNVIAHCRCR
jgi:spermidine synthase